MELQKKVFRGHGDSHSHSHGCAVIGILLERRGNASLTSLQMSTRSQAAIPCWMYSLRVGVMP